MTGAFDDDGDGGNGERDQGSDPDPAPSTAFAALSDPVRVEILESLAEAHRERGERVVGFADLRRQVGVRDSGRFRYHLNELRDRFVAKDRTEGGEGYRLTHAGRQVVAAIVAGHYVDEVSLGPSELDSACPTCGEAAVATCDDGRCRVTCPNDHRLFAWTVPPNAAAGEDLPDVVEVAELLATQAIELSLAGVCPTCSETVDPEVVLADDGTPSAGGGTSGGRPRFRAACGACGGRVVGPVGFCLLADPEVAAFCRRHDRPVEESHVWELPFVADESAVAVAGEDPVRVAFEFALDGETLAGTVDESGTVVDVDLPA